MQGRSHEFDALIANPPVEDPTERTAVLLENLAAEVRRHGVVDGQLTRDRGVPGSRVQKVTTGVDDRQEPARRILTRFSRTRRPDLVE